MWDRVKADDYPHGPGKDHMMTTKALQRLVEQRRDDIQRIARAHGAESIRLIGSVARGDEHAASDLDFLVRFESGRSLFDQAGLIHELERAYPDYPWHEPIGMRNLLAHEYWRSDPNL